MKREKRYLKTEVRAKAGDDGRQIEGYASMFNQPYEINSWFSEFTEIIDPNAFSRCLAEKPDVTCLFNHDPNWILGRTTANTLTLSIDAKGLAYRCSPPSGPLAQHATDAIDRGDVDASSFEFSVRKDSWVDEKDDQGRIVKSTRTILDADVFDVSPVVYPANPHTSAAMRSLWPDGIPTELRSRFEKRNTHCECTCQECQDGNCRECSNPDCEDPNCEAEDDDQAGRSLTPKLRQAVRGLVDSILDSIEARDDAKTKKVDGVDLTSECFAYVGDPEKTSTWKLPIKFPDDEEKTKSHIDDALARFDQTKGIPADEKPKVLAKIKAAAKAHGIKVADDDEKNSLTPDDVEQRKRRLRQLSL
jgi:HK97 family phage prohead protease